MKNVLFKPTLSFLLQCSFILTTFLVSGCQKEIIEPNSPDVEAMIGQDKVAANGENPFTVKMMRRAYESLRKAKSNHAIQYQPGKKLLKSNDRFMALPAPTDCLDCPQEPAYPSPTPIYPTHKYIRFKPANTDQLADLDQAGYRLSWQPFDESVAATTTVNFQADEIPWIYTVVPAGTAYPANVRVELIDELFLFNPEDGDEQDVDPFDPAPTPNCNPQYDYSCACYRACPVQLIAGTAGKRSRQSIATEELKKHGISPLDLYNEAMTLSGHADEAINSTNSNMGLVASTNGVRYNPQGVIKVEDTSLKMMVPVKGVKVESRRWFQLGSAYTTAQGNFYISTSYKTTAKISLEFKNSLATTRGIITGIKFWQSVLPINAEIGTYQNENIKNIAYNIPYVGGLDKVGSKGASIWSAATLFNTLIEHNTFSAARNLPVLPRDLNIWLFPDFPKPGNAGGAGAAPMLRKIASTSVVSQALDFVLAGSGLVNVALVKQILQRQLPDITVRYGSDIGALNTYSLVQLYDHELAHAQHYGQVGNNFWTAYINHIVAYGGYGGKSSSGSGRISISEGWAAYLENLLTIDRYTASPNSSFLATLSLEYLENQTPTDYNNVYNQGWFVYGMYHDMTDGGIEPTSTGVVDNVTAFSPTLVFRGLQSDVYSVRGYESKINTQNNRAQAAQLNQLVTSYRW